MALIARRYDTEEVVSIEIAEGKITSIELVDRAAGDAALPYVAPGFVDLQVNGYDGIELATERLTVDDVQRLARGMHSCGVTSFLPTVTTQSQQTMLHAIRRIGAACDAGAISVAGIHVEGPSISADDGPRGAHPAEHVRPPSIEEFQQWQEASGGRVKIITLSPEWDNTAEYIEHVTRAGVVVAIGHTAATPEQIAAAVEAGASMSTHLGNGAAGMVRRHPNFIWSQLADDRLTASLIADGFHLPGEVLKVMLRAKTPARCVLVSDVTGMAGKPAGRYSTSLGDVEVLEDGRLVVADQRQYLAGAALPIGPCVLNAMRSGGLSLQQAVELASVQPAKLIGGRCGGLEVGEVADLVLFDLHDDELIVRETIVAGESMTT
jgi:N-acetylglucosamine-6-phosphate deacetylase